MADNGKVETSTFAESAKKHAATIDKRTGERNAILAKAQVLRDAGLAEDNSVLAGFLAEAEALAGEITRERASMARAEALDKIADKLTPVVEAFGTVTVADSGTLPGAVAAVDLAAKIATAKASAQRWTDAATAYSAAQAALAKAKVGDDLIADVGALSFEAKGAKGITLKIGSGVTRSPSLPVVIAAVGEGFPAVLVGQRVRGDGAEWPTFAKLRKAHVPDAKLPQGMRENGGTKRSGRAQLESVGFVFETAPVPVVAEEAAAE